MVPDSQQIFMVQMKIRTAGQREPARNLGVSAHRAPPDACIIEVMFRTGMGSGNNMRDAVGNAIFRPSRANLPSFERRHLSQAGRDNEIDHTP